MDWEKVNFIMYLMALFYLIGITLRGFLEEHGLLLSRFQKEGKFIVGFAGAHGIANSLYAVIDAVSSLAEQNVVLVLVGGGQEKENLIKYAHKKEIVNVYFLPTIDKLAIPNLLKEMDVLYIGLQKQSLFRFGISPNKMFDYMMAAKPIIQAIDAGNNLVGEADCGIDVEPDNVGEISKAIFGVKIHARRRKKKIRREVKNLFSRIILIKCWESVFSI